MRTLLLLCSLAFGITASANDSVVTDTSRNLAALPPGLTNAKGPYQLANGNSVYLLPADNMPCVVPAPQHYQMPNLAGKRTLPAPDAPGAMPQVKPVLPLRQTALLPGQSILQSDKRTQQPKIKKKTGFRLAY
ncbi:hypothetical protein JMG10_32525 [Nostoc ellipsosporum NOK]|nr:hypothetical protein [Nostoc ellipsosporum NOK]